MERFVLQVSQTLQAVMITNVIKRSTKDLHLHMPYMGR